MRRALNIFNEKGAVCRSEQWGFHHNKGGPKIKNATVMRTFCLAIVGLFVLSSGIAFAQSQSNEGLPWDALIEVSGGSVGVGIGFSWGGGKLTQAGK